MSNKVTYIFLIQDKYSRIAEKMKRVTEKFRKPLQKIPFDFKKIGSAIVAVKQKMISFGRVASAKMKSFANSTKRAGRNLTLFATLPIGFLGKGLLDAASDAEETRSKFDTVFKAIKSKSNETADRLARDYGLAGSTSRKLMSDTGDLLSGFGFTQKAALDLSTKVNELAVDLASFTNFSGGAEGASAALTKALLGERESVKSLGIAILEEDVKKKVQLMRSKGMRFATMRQAKAYATLQIAIGQSKNAIGDYARTQDSYANKTRAMEQRTLNLKEKLGEILIPVVLKVVDIITKLVDRFSKLSPTTKKIILIIIGLVAVIGPLLLIIGGIIAAVPLLVAGFLAIVSPIGLIITAIIAAGVAFLAWKDDLFKSIMAIAGFIKDKLLAVFDSVGEKLTSISNFLSFEADDINVNKRSESIVTSNSKSSADVNVNLRAPEGTVESIRSKVRGNAGAMNIGVSMAAAL